MCSDNLLPIILHGLMDLVARHSTPPMMTPHEIRRPLVQVPQRQPLLLQVPRDMIEDGLLRERPDLLDVAVLGVLGVHWFSSV
jgi:hypothetical protein